MLKETLLRSLKTAISDVLETMFFQPVQIDNNHRCLKEWFAKDPPLLGASLGFAGPISGICYILIPDQGVQEMTANFLGIDEKEVDREQALDTIKEALNMIVGQALSLFDKTGDFQLSIPEIIDGDAVAPEKLQGSQGDILLFETEDSHLAAGLIT